MALWGRSAPIRVMSLALLVGCASQQKKDARVVKDVHITGNDELSSREIKKKILTEETGWWPFATKQYFDPVTWQSDLRRIERLYAAKGFYQAEIVKDQVVPDPPDDVQLEVQVREGKPTHVGKMEVEGLPPADRAAVIKGLPLAPGAVFREEDWAATKRQLADRLRNRGYAKASVDGRALVDVKTQRADLTLIVDVGAPLLLRRDRGRQRARRTRAGDGGDGAGAPGGQGGPHLQRRRAQGGAAAALRHGRVRDDPGHGRRARRDDGAHSRSRHRPRGAVPHAAAGRGGAGGRDQERSSRHRRVDEPRLPRRDAAADHPRRGRVGVSPERLRRRER